jgi:hypothetical protein
MHESHVERAVDDYLNQVLWSASLCRGDDRRVRGELLEHLHELTVMTEGKTFTQPEILAMLHAEFGNPEAVGEAIAAAKGRFRTYLKKQRRRLPMHVAIGLVLGFSIRCAVAESFYAADDAVAPMVPKGSRMLVYKLGSTYKSEDIVVFLGTDGVPETGIVKAVADNSDQIKVARNGFSDKSITRSSVIGRVVLNTR